MVLKNTLSEIKMDVSMVVLNLFSVAAGYRRGQARAYVALLRAVSEHESAVPECET